ncbi:MAG: winged helix-turn-helix domain-containing protein, partial [Bryobacteraceae bacterium]
MRLRLEGQPIAVLALLLEHPGELITREEIQKRLWSADTFVDFEHSLNAAVRRLRAALNDSADTPRYIETQARRGYRFIAPVATEQVAAPAAGFDEPPPVAAGHAFGRIPRWFWPGVVCALVVLGLAIWGWGAWRRREAGAAIRSLA